MPFASAARRELRTFLYEGAVLSASAYSEIVGPRYQYLAHARTGTDVHAGFADDGSSFRIVYRGTEPSRPEDLWTDAQFLRSAGWRPSHPGRYAAGPLRAYLSVREQVDALLPPDIPIWIFGHSLGGTLAQLCAQDYTARFPGREIRWASYGAGHCFSYQAARHFNFLCGDKGFRVVNNCDIVPRVSSLLWKGGGPLVYISSTGHVHLSAGMIPRAADRVWGRLNSIGDLRLKAIEDHKISRYAHYLHPGDMS
jgi:hypothetical protein